MRTVILALVLAQTVAYADDGESSAEAAAAPAPAAPADPNAADAAVPNAVPGDTQAAWGIDPGATAEAAEPTATAQVEKKSKKKAKK